MSFNEKVRKANAVRRSFPHLIWFHIYMYARLPLSVLTGIFACVSNVIYVLSPEKLLVQSYIFGADETLLIKDALTEDKYALFQTVLVVLAVFGIINAIFSVVVFIKFISLDKTGYKLNMIYLGFTTVAAIASIIPAALIPAGEAAIMSTAMTTIGVNVIWLALNYVYFKKRKILFEKSGS